MSEQDNPALAAPPSPVAAVASPVLRVPSRWHDPLKLIQTEAPSDSGRIVLWSVSVLVLVLIVWAVFGKLDIIVSAEGKLAPQTLVKIVQPAEAGVVSKLLVAEGDAVVAGQLLARLDATLASADKTGVSSDLAAQKLQVRRLEALLANTPMQRKAGDDAQAFDQVQRQYAAHRQAFLESLEQERSLLLKAESDRDSARQVLAKLEQTLPLFQTAAAGYASLAKDGYMGALQAAEKQREAIEKEKDLGAQKATVAALGATVVAQQKRISQLQSANQSGLEKELADIRARIGQLQPTLDKTMYREGQMELRAPQAGVIKDLATTTVGAVVQPGTVVLTLVPKGERLFADVSLKNENVGFVQLGQRAQVKLAAYPFQRYGMLHGKVIYIGADATESGKSDADKDGAMAGISTYKARIELDAQRLVDPQGNALHITPGMQVVVEIHQGRRTVMEYLLSPVKKTVAEAGRER